MNEKGSVLVLTMICVMLLSILVLGLLSVGTTETHTTMNIHLDKLAYYKAIEGVEVVINEIRSLVEATQISNIAVDKYDFREQQKGTWTSFITGSILDAKADTPKNVQNYTGFTPPPLTGTSMSTEMKSVIWYVPITSEVEFGTRAGRRAYKELSIGVLSVLNVSY